MPRRCPHRQYLGQASSRTYVITAREDGQPFGALELRHAGPNRLGFGYVLAQPAWGRG
jgi:hypothetical protein